VVKIADGSTVACHDSEDEAQAQLRALYASEPNAGTQNYAVELTDLLETLAVDFGDDDESLTEYLTEFDISRLPPQLHAYWLGPKGSARVGGWGNEGSWTKCTIEMRKEGVPGRMIKGLCANLYHEATGHTPNQKHNLAEDEVEEFADAPTEPYGDVKYADPGYQSDNRKRYPIDTPEHIRAAWSYINMPKNAAKYSSDQLKSIKNKIKKALSGTGADVQAAVVVVSAARSKLKAPPDVSEKNATDEATRDCPPGMHKMPDGNCMDDADMPQQYADEPWQGILTVEGAESGDGRMFSLGSLDWAALPLPLMYQPANVGGHTGSVIVGQITHAARKGSEIAGWGHVTGEALAGEHGDGIRQMMESGGVSVDVDKVKDADVEMIYADEEAAGGFMAKPETTIFHRGRIRGATLVAFPAFVEAKLHFTNQVVTAAADCGCGNNDLEAYEFDADEPLTAAAHTITIPDLPKASWFSKPVDVKMYGALTVTDEGRVFGRLAPSNVTHRAVKRRVPMRTVDYSRWMNKETIVEGGERIVTGVITMNCGHAATENYGTLANRKEHYDNSCSIVANVRIGEDADGVWVAGALQHGVTSEQVSKMMGCTLSGDWQPHPDRAGITEFIAALLVPVPGFPEARTSPSVTYTDGVLSASAVPIRLGFEEEPDPVQTAFEAIRTAKQVLVASLGIEVDPKVRKELIMAELCGRKKTEVVTSVQAAQLAEEQRAALRQLEDEAVAEAERWTQSAVNAIGNTHSY
jgi:hypothetical protein